MVVTSTSGGEETPGVRHRKGSTEELRFVVGSSTLGQGVDSTEGFVNFIAATTKSRMQLLGRAYHGGRSGDGR